jgi:hypothetical protein
MQRCRKKKIDFLLFMQQFSLFHSLLQNMHFVLLVAFIQVYCFWRLLAIILWRVEVDTMVACLVFILTLVNAWLLQRVETGIIIDSMNPLHFRI